MWLKLHFRRGDAFTTFQSIFETVVRTGDDRLTNLALGHFEPHVRAGILETTDFFGKPSDNYRIPVNIQYPGFAISDVFKRLSYRPFAVSVVCEGRSELNTVRASATKSLGLLDLCDLWDLFLDRFFHTSIKCQLRGRTSITSAQEPDFRAVSFYRCHLCISAMACKPWTHSLEVGFNPLIELCFKDAVSTVNCINAFVLSRVTSRRTKARHLFHLCNHTPQRLFR